MIAQGHIGSPLIASNTQQYSAPHVSNQYVGIYGSQPSMMRSGNGNTCPTTFGTSLVHQQATPGGFNQSTLHHQYQQPIPSQNTPSYYGVPSDIKPNTTTFMNTPTTLDNNNNCNMGFSQQGKPPIFRAPSYTPTTPTHASMVQPQLQQTRETMHYQPTVPIGDSNLFSVKEFFRHADTSLSPHITSASNLLQPYQPQQPQPQQFSNYKQQSQNQYSNYHIANPSTQQQLAHTNNSCMDGISQLGNPPKFSSGTQSFPVSNSTPQQVPCSQKTVARENNTTQPVTSSSTSVVSPSSTTGDKGSIKVTRNIRADRLETPNEPVELPQDGVLYVYNVENWTDKNSFYDKIAYSFGMLFHL